MEEFALSEEAISALKAASKPGLERLFFDNEGVVVHKWVHYLPIYEQYFSRYQNSPVKMLEIGVNKGGSLNLWREYFGPKATIFGIDVNPHCAHVAAAPNQVRIGSQADPAFLVQVVDEMGAPDIVLDDGSHIGRHQRASFATLFPLLADGGLYVIEDTHTAYWPTIYEGGYRKPGTAIEFVKNIIDDMHGWYHGKPKNIPHSEQVGSLHVFDSIIIIEKRVSQRPGHAKIGASAAPQQ